MEVDDQGPFKLSVPQNVSWPVILMSDTKGVDFTLRPWDDTLDSLVMPYMDNTLSTPAHEKHMNLSCAMQEVDLGQVDFAKCKKSCEYVMLKNSEASNVRKRVLR